MNGDAGVIALRRRMAMRSLLGGGAAAALSGCDGLLPALRDPTPVVTPGLSAIDVHCHVFNALDLPIKAFVEQVYLHDHDGPDPTDLADPLIDMLVEIMRGDPDILSAAEEARRLRAKQTVAPSPPRDTDALLNRSVAGATRRILARGMVRAPAVTAALAAARCLGPPPTAHLAAAAYASQSMKEFLHRLSYAMAPPPATLAPAAAAAAPPTPEEVAAGAVKPNNPLKGLLLMATLMTRPRSELVRRVAGLADEGGAEIRLITPAMIDFTYWLNDQPPSSLADQIEVMSAISASSGRSYAVHGWVSFCPWRQLREPDQFALVQQAVESKGFVGIKIYPVMGFYPIDNAKASFPNCAHGIDGFGSKLDEALIRLYQWCADEEVPVLAHCSFSQNPSEDAGLRGDPQHWERVVKRFPKLRLNLAHYGGLWRYKDKGKDRDVGWTETATRMMHQYPYIYADVADYSAVHDQSKDDYTKVIAKVASHLNRYPKARDKLMFGTDWMFLAMDLRAGTYYQRMKRNFAADLGLPEAAFLGGNAARFLGLMPENGTIPKTRARLEAFYSANGLDRTVLDYFGKLPKPIA